MVDAGVGAGGNAFGDILNNWSNIANLFLAFVVAGLYPFLKYISSKVKAWKEHKKNRQRDSIIDLANKVQEPLKKDMKGITELISKYSEQNEAIIENLEKFNTAFDEMSKSVTALKENQTALNIRTAFVTKFFQDNIQLKQGLSQPTGGNVQQPPQTKRRQPPPSKRFDHRTEDIENDEDTTAFGQYSGDDPFSNNS